MAGGGHPELMAARGGYVGSLHYGRLMLHWPLVTTWSCFCSLRCLPPHSSSPSNWRLPHLCTSCSFPGSPFALLPEAHYGATRPGPPSIFHIPRQTEVCPGLASHGAASLGKENSKTLYSVKSCLDGRVGSWYVRAGTFRGKSCRAKQSPDETLSGRHRSSREREKVKTKIFLQRSWKGLCRIVTTSFLNHPGPPSS